MNIVEKILDTLGITVIPHAFGLSKFEIHAPIESEKLKQVKKNIAHFTKKNVEDALAYCKELFADEMQRGEKIESKAYNLIGVTGISAAFITGISKLLPDKTVEVFPWQNISLMVIYILIVISLTITILLASKVVIVGGYKFAYPDFADIFNINSRSLNTLKKERLNDYLYCYINNYKIHNIKASFLIGSQLWFRNTVILFLMLAFILTPSIFISLSDNHQISQTPTFIVNSDTPTPITPRASSTYTPYQTSTQQVSPSISITTTMTMTATQTPSAIQTP